MRAYSKKLLIMGFVILLTMMFLSNTLDAQIAGRITGRVTDSSTGGFLPGANLVLKGTNLGDASDRSGHYLIKNVPPGTYTLVVTYIGYKRFTADVTVTANETVKQDVALKVSYVQGEEVVVEGMRQGQIKALSQQRMAANIKNVVAQEQIERFPDENTAEVLQRIPGVYIQRSLGDGRYAMIRGTAPGLNMVTVNGEKLATNRVEERYSQLDIIGSSQLASVEVVKAITPDMDGDAIGGTINLITRSAFDYPGRRMKVTLGSGYANIDGKILGEGKVSYSNLFGANKNLGLTFTANWDRKERGADDAEYDFDSKEDINDNPIPFALTDFDMRKYILTRSRYGVGGGLEYKKGENHQWFFRGLYSKYVDDEWRTRWRLRIDKGNYLNPEGTLTEKSRIVAAHTGRVENLVQTDLSAGGIHKFGDKQFDYTVAYSYASEHHPFQLQSEWKLNEKVNLALNLSNMYYPEWQTTNLDPSYQYDAANYEFDGFDYRETYATNAQLVGTTNFKLPYTLKGLPAELKIGAKVRADRKDRDEDRWKVKWKGDEDLMLSQFVADRQVDDFMNGHYKFGPMPDRDKLKDFFKLHKEDGLLKFQMKWWDSEAQYYVSRENVYAYYAMTTVNMGKFMFLGGFRQEFTQAKYKGSQLNLDNDGNLASLDRVTVDRNYNNFLPMLHVRYRLSPMTNIRAAFTQTFARPNYWYVSPYLYIDPDHEEIEQGNPQLKPTVANNLDLEFTRYFYGIGLASCGFFYKKLNDIIFEKQSKVVGGVWDDYDLTQPVNGGDATLYGVELAWQQELSFLPGFLNGFGIYANYTHTWSDADLLDRKGFLPGQSGDVGNISLSYEKYRFSGRISAMYQAKFLNEVGKTEDWDVWKDGHMELDFSATYDILPWLKVYAEAINLANAPRFDYYGIKDRPKQREFYSWWAKMGLKFDF
ncbi:MAG: TonB-dependent receptor [Calditrichaeota bacterium]|nr:TonB-dependent receptor [Calditrichota bacterium]